MQNSLGDHGALSWTKFHGPAFEINQQLPFDDVEKLIVVIMLVPVIFALHHAETNYGTVHLAKRLVVPTCRCRCRRALFRQSVPVADKEC